MPAEVKHKFASDKSGPPLIQLASSFTARPDGFIEIPLEFVVTPYGLAVDYVSKLQARSGQKLPQNLATIRNLPKTTDIFINKVASTYRNGLHYVSLDCASCVTPPLAVVSVNLNTQQLSGSSIIQETDANGNDNATTFYWSFTIKVPSVTVKSTVPSSNQGRPNAPASVQLTSYSLFEGSINIAAPGYSNELRFRAENIKGARGLSRAEKKYALIETVSENNDGNIAHLTYTYTIEVTDK